MANIRDVTPDMEAEYLAWIEAEGMAPETRAVAQRLRPWRLYWMPIEDGSKEGHRVVIHSFQYVKDRPLTMTVAVLGRFNLVTIERLVFGIDPNRLTECDLPPPDEPVGVIHDTPEAELAHVNFMRAQNGLGPLTMDDLNVIRAGDRPGKPTLQ